MIVVCSRTSGSAVGCLFLEGIGGYMTFGGISGGDPCLITLGALIMITGGVVALVAARVFSLAAKISIAGLVMAGLGGAVTCFGMTDPDQGATIAGSIMIGGGLLTTCVASRFFQLYVSGPCAELYKALCKKRQVGEDAALESSLINEEKKDSATGVPVGTSNT